MKCDNAVDLIVDSLMDSLDEDQRQALSAHVQSCPSCAAEAARMKGIWQGLGELSVPAASPQAAFDFGRRVLAMRRRPRIAQPMLAAAAVGLLMIGGVSGFMIRGGETPPDPPSAQASAFLFLVRGEVSDETLRGEDLVAEYRSWAASLADQGRLLGSNKLMDEPGRWISGSAAGDSRTQSDVGGYFLVNAASYSEAVAIAGSSPHVRYGGTFEIRQIDPLN